MSQNATKSGTLLRYAVQTDPELPAPPGATAYALPRVNFTQGTNRQSVPSNLVKGDKQKSAPSTGTMDAQGNLETELMIGQDKHFEEAALQARYRAPSVTGTATVDIDASGTITDTAGALTGGKLRVGAVFNATGFANTENNGAYVVVGMFGTKIYTVPMNFEIDKIPPKPETAATITVSARGMGVHILTEGHVFDTFTIEQYHSEVDVSRTLAGMQVETMNVGWSGPNAKVSKTFAFKGRESLPLLENEGEYFQNVTPFTPRESIDTSVGFMVIDGLRYCILESFSLNVGAPIQTDYGVLCDKVIGTSSGDIAVTGDFVAVYRDATIEKVYEAEQTVNAVVCVYDPKGEIKTYTMPNMKITQANAGDDQTIKLSCSYESYRGDVKPGLPDTSLAIHDTAMA